MVATLGDRFWDIVDSTVDEDQDIQIEALQKALKKLSSEQVVAFENDFQRASVAAYRWDLWGAAYVINGGCSDDGFMDFRSWLIAQGRAVYDAAMADPESLADYIKEDFAEFEEFAYVSNEVYMEKTDDDLPPTSVKHPADPEGEGWDEDDLDTLFPRITAKVKSLE